MGKKVLNKKECCRWGGGTYLGIFKKRQKMTACKPLCNRRPACTHFTWGKRGSSASCAKGARCRPTTSGQRSFHLGRRTHLYRFDGVHALKLASRPPRPALASGISRPWGPFSERLPISWLALALFSLVCSGLARCRSCAA